MPEGRFLSKKIAADYELNTAVSLEADYLFTRCIPHLDREGRMAGHPAQVKALAAPLRSEITPEVVDRCLEELAAAGLVLWYEVEGRPYLRFSGFEKNQQGMRKDREAESQVPSPHHPESQQVTTVLRTNSGPTPVEVRPSEVKGSEVKVSTEDKSSAAGAAADEHDWTGTDVTDDGQWAKLRTELFSPLRKHIWRGKKPPPNVPKNGRKWDEARELSYIRDWIRGGLFRPDEAEAFLERAPKVMGWDGPASLSWIGKDEHIPRIREIVGELRKRRMRKLDATAVIGGQP